MISSVVLKRHYTICRECQAIRELPRKREERPSPPAVTSTQRWAVTLSELWQFVALQSTWPQFPFLPKRSPPALQVSRGLLVMGFGARARAGTVDSLGCCAPHPDTLGWEPSEVPSINRQVAQRCSKWPGPQQPHVSGQN